MHLLIDQSNHLAILTAEPIEVSVEAPAIINFADGTNQAYGPGSMKQVGSVFMMITGDANGDGVVNAVDKSIWTSENGTFPDYLNFSDFNRDGQSNAVDYNIYFRPNNSIQSQIWFDWH